MAGVKESIFREGADLGDGFFEVGCRRVGKVGTANTVFEDGVTDKEGT